MFIGRPD